VETTFVPGVTLTIDSADRDFASVVTLTVPGDDAAPCRQTMMTFDDDGTVVLGVKTPMTEERLSDDHRRCRARIDDQRRSGRRLFGRA